MLTLHRILCPVDFSEPSKRALRYALAVARWHESEIAVLHVEDLLLHAATIEAGDYPELAERHIRNSGTSSKPPAARIERSGCTLLPVARSRAS